MSQPFNLFRLQQIDSQIDQVRSRLQQIEVALRDHTAVLEATRLENKKKGAFEAANRVLQQADENVNAQRIKIEQTESTLYGGKVRNPKELQDLQNESVALKRYLDTLEDRQLEALITFEETEIEHKAAAENLARIEEDVKQSNRALTLEQSGLREEITRLNVERESIATPIPQEDYSIYEKLRLQRRGVAVARINNNVCEACGSSLNAALLQAARSPNQITRCESCGRILYAG